MKTNLRTVTRLALVLLVTFGTSLAQNQLKNPTTLPPSLPTTLVVLANRQTLQRLWPVLLSTLRTDAAAESRTAPVDGNVQIVLAGSDSPGPVFPTRIEVELLGTCDDPWNANAPSRQGPLGFVLEDSGKIAPIIYVDCAQVNKLLSPSTRPMTENVRLHAESEAISHVILHEWIHIATQSPEHASHGIMQSTLSLTQLTTPITDTESTHAKSQEKSENQRSSGGGLLLRGVTVVIDDQQ
jgi:hypothetical protein